MSLQKYGCFKKTRRYRPFRCKVDKKKIQKLKKDVVKAAKKKLHLRKERIRLMKKAVKETRERDSAKARAKASLRKKQN